VSNAFFVRNHKNIQKHSLQTHSSVVPFTDLFAWVPKDIQDPNFIFAFLCVLVIAPLVVSFALGVWCGRCCCRRSCAECKVQLFWALDKPNAKFHTVKTCRSLHNKEGIRELIVCNHSNAVPQEDICERCCPKNDKVMAKKK
jgi:hypothetical protein